MSGVSDHGADGGSRGFDILSCCGPAPLKHGYRVAVVASLKNGYRVAVVASLKDD